jgi:hypothetical protein
VDRQIAVTAQIEVLVVPEIGSRQFDGLAFREQSGEGDAAFKACEWRANAIMMAVPEAQMMIRLSGSVEAVWIEELARVPVGCSHHRQNKVAAPQSLTAAVHVFEGDPPQKLQWAVVAQQLLDRIGYRRYCPPLLGLSCI